MTSPATEPPVPGDRGVTTRLTLWSLVAVPVPVWLLLTYVLFAPLLKNPTGPLPGGADSVLYSWYFKEIQVSLWHGDNPFFSTGMNAPTGLNVMWNTAIILPALLLTPVTAALGASTSVALLMIAAPLVAAAVTYRVLYRMTGSLPGAAVGGTLYGFGPFYAGQQGHVHLTAGAVFLPLILSLGYQLFTSPHRTWRQLGWRLGVVVGITMLVSEEIVAIAAIVTLLSLVALALRYRPEVRSRLPFVARTGGWAAGVALCICGPALAYQFLGPLVVGQGIHSSLALDLLAVVRPPSSMFFSTAADAAVNRHFPVDGVENTGYLGVGLLLAIVLAGVVLVRIGRPRLVFWLGSTTVLTFATSLGTSIRINGVQTYIPTPWLVLSRVPVLETVVQARLSAATLLLVATILAFGIAALPQLTTETRARRLRVVGVVLVGVGLIACWPAPGGRDRLAVTTPAFFTTPAVQQIRAGSVVLALPQPQSPDGAATVMRWQIQAGMRFDILGGYSYFSRDGTPHYEGDMPGYAALLQQVGATGVPPSATESADARASLTASAGDFVVVTDQVAHPAAVIAALPAIAGCTPQRVSDVYLCRIVR